MAIKIKRGDRLPKIEATVKKDDGTIFDLTGATAAFYMANARSGVLKVNNGSASITDATAGVVEYNWGSEDTDTTGEYHAEFEMTFVADGKKITAPSEGYISIVIAEDLD